MQKFRIALKLIKSKAKGATDKEKEKSKIPIYFRIYINGKRTFKSSGYEIEPKYWDFVNEKVKSNFRIASMINADLEVKKNDLIKELIEKQIGGKEISVSSVRETLQVNGKTNIFRFVEKWKTEVESKRGAGTLENYRKHLKKLEDFHGNKNLNFEDITADYLIKYEAHLSLTVGDNYIHGLLKTLRTFFNAAKKQELITCYPFTIFEFPKYKSPTKDYLTIGELKSWEKYIPKIKDPAIYESAIYFLFSSYSGLRISDWYKFSKANIHKDMMRLTTTKTDTDVSMPISKPLQRAIDLVLRHPRKIEEATLNEKLKEIAATLEIAKHLTAHSARHTFAVTVCLSNKISSETAAQLMGITLKTFVENYSQVTDEKIRRETAAGWKHLS